TTSTNSTTTTRTIRATIGVGSSFPWGSQPNSVSVHHERCRAPDFYDFDAFARIEHLVFVEAACGPHLAVDLHAADSLVVGDPREHDPRGDEEHDRGEQDSYAQQAHNRRERGAGSERRQVEAALVHLAQTEDAGRYQPKNPCVHPSIIPQRRVRGRNRPRRTVAGPRPARRSRSA